MNLVKSMSLPAQQASLPAYLFALIPMRGGRAHLKRAGAKRDERVKEHEERRERWAESGEMGEE